MKGDLKKTGCVEGMLGETFVLLVLVEAMAGRFWMLSGPGLRAAKSQI